MRRLFAPLLLAVLAVGLFVPAAAFADSYEVGALSFDPSTLSLTGPADFNIVNLSGTLLSPVTTPLSFSITSLWVDFSNGSTETLTGSDFTTDWLGITSSNESFATTGSGPFVTEAILTGTASPADAKVWGVGPVAITGITSTLTDPTGGHLCLLDTAAIYATTDPITPTPEPDTLLLLGAGLGVLALAAAKTV